MSRLSIGWLLLLLASPTGCMPGPEGAYDHESVIETSEQLTLESINRRVAPTVCWVKPSGLSAADSAYWDSERARAESIIHEWDQHSGLNSNWIGLCPGPDANGNYNTTIRILMDNDWDPAHYPRQIPGCTVTEDFWNWGAFPSESLTRIKCKYNAHFAIGISRNNFLHEFGHTIGFVHEHLRVDNPDTLCPGDDIYQPPSSPYLTYYDVNSVMHYGPYSPQDADGDGLPDPDPWSACPAPGNLSNTGLSAGDQLGVEMTYPRTLSHGIAGGKLFRDDQPLRFKYDWRAREAHPTWFKNSAWKLIKGATVNTNNVVDPAWSASAAGVYTLTATFSDPFGATHSVNETIEVLTRSNHTARIIQSFL